MPAAWEKNKIKGKESKIREQFKEFTCICRLTTSNGYVKVCPNKPAKAPQERRNTIEFWCSAGTLLLSSSYI